MLSLAACDHPEQTAGTTEAAFPFDSVRAEIAASNAIFGASFGKNDSTAFLNCYATDACIFPTGMPKLCGPAALAQFFKGGVSMGIRNIVLKTDELFGGKDGVSETGTYEMLGEKNVSLEKGKFMVLWKKVDGKWKMFRDVWNSDGQK